MIAPAQTWKVLALVAIVLGLVGVGAGCGSDDDEASGTTEPAATTGPGAATTAPDVQGAQLSEAAVTMAEAGLRVGVLYVPSTQPRGQVLGQENPPGTPLQRGDAVSMNVSIGPAPLAKVTVPNVAGTEAEGRAILEAAGFEVQTIRTPAVPDDVVISISPPAFDRIPRGSLVILYAGGASRASYFGAGSSL